MKTFLIFSLIILSNIVLKAQTFLESKECNRNINELLPLGTSVKTSLLNSSTFKFDINGSCTGTLVNRYISTNPLCG